MLTDQPAAGAAFERRVSEARSQDVGRAIARLDPDDLKALGVRIGDAIAIRGKKPTVCRAMPAFKEHRGSGTVNLDGVARLNAGCGLGDPVRVEPIECERAESVVLSPLDLVPSERDLDYIAGLIDGVPMIVGDRVRVTLFGSRTADFVVSSTSPSGPCVVHPTTRLVIETGGRERSADGVTPRLAYEDVGGLKPQLARIREMIELPLRFPQVFDRLGIDPPKGVLLHGPPGTGKTLIARTIAHEAEANFFTVSGPEIVHKHYGESEKHLREIFDRAAKKGPSIIFIDEIDSIAPQRERTEGEVEKRIVAQLLALMDGLSKRQSVIVIAATNLPNNIDPALRRPGRFDREIEIPIPDRHGRRHILDIHSRGMPLADDVDLDHLAAVTHGYVGADLEALCRESAMACLRTILHDIDFARASIPYEQIQSLEISMQHFRSGLAEVEPSAVRAVFVEIPDVRWDDIGGLEETKQRLVEAVEWPMIHGDIFEQVRVRPPKGVMLAGPPGVGKTMLAKALATETEANFISVKGPELLSKFVGESERGMREVFRKARQASPCIVFFDEIEALLPKRGHGPADSGVGERVLSQFLAEMDGVEELKDVLVLAATNRLDMLDEALLRPGRFDEIVEIGVPDERARIEIYRIHLSRRPLAPGIDFNDLASRSQGASAAQIAAICDRAARAAVRRAVVVMSADPDAPCDVCIQPSDVESALAEEFGA